MDITIQVDDSEFKRFAALCDALGILAGDYVEGVVADAIKGITGEISGILNRYGGSK